MGLQVHERGLMNVDVFTGSVCSKAAQRLKRLNAGTVTLLTVVYLNSIQIAKTNYFLLSI